MVEHVLETRKARFGLLSIIIVAVLNIMFLVHSSFIEVAPLYPLYLLGKHFESTDPYLGAYLQFLASSLGRFFWIIIVVTFGLLSLSPKDVGLRLDKIKEGVKVTALIWIAL